VITQEEDDHLPAKEEPQKESALPHLPLRLLVSRMVRKQTCCLNPELWYPAPTNSKE
jgi:hypothetical protein